jgi:Spy/CpxP family protein refolding chaperone
MGSPVTKSRLLAGSVLVATFIAGAMVGGATVQLVARESSAELRRPGDSGRDGERRSRSSMFDDLDLTAQQQARIDSIFENRRSQTARFWEEHGPQMRAIVDSTRAEIDRILTPEQRARAEQWRAERKKRHDEERREHGDTTRPRTSLEDWRWLERSGPPRLPAS